MKKLPINVNFCFTLMSLALLCSVARVSAFDPRAVLRESEARHRSASQEYRGELTVVNKEGKERRKGWRSFRQGYAADAKNLIRFLDPPEVKGVGFLSLAQPGGKSPDQWLYLPSMKRERRIAAQDRDASFVGTDFSYEDMEEFDHEKYELSGQGEETVAGQPCLVIAATPREGGGRSAYARKVLFLRRDILYPLQEEFYRPGEKEPSKRLLFSDLRQIDGHWLAMRMEMSDLKKGSKTTVLFQEVVFDRPQPAGRFTLQNLNREGGE